MMHESAWTQSGVARKAKLLYLFCILNMASFLLFLFCIHCLWTHYEKNKCILSISNGISFFFWLFSEKSDGSIASLKSVKEKIHANISEKILWIIYHIHTVAYYRNMRVRQVATTVVHSNEPASYFQFHFSLAAEIQTPQDGGRHL